MSIPQNSPTHLPLGALTPILKTGDEPFLEGDKPLGIFLIDFWRWSASDLTNNALRGVLAEFLVARALDCTLGVRTEWDAYDLLTPNGLRIEVKSSAYLQSWHQKKHSVPCFTIGMRYSWDATTNTSAQIACRAADVYVFALLHHKDKTTVDPLQMAQWTFYILPAAVLNERHCHQKTISLNALIKAGAKSATYVTLPHVLETMNIESKCDIQ